jgi:hypothetical protein
MVYDTLNLSTLQAARSAQTLPMNPYNMFATPVPLSRFVTLLADNGAEVLLGIGTPLTTPAPIGPDVVFDVNFSQALPISGVCPGMAQFVTAVCGAPGFSSCRDIGGVSQSSCLGYFANTTLDKDLEGAITSTCTAVCANSQDPDIGAACRAIIVDNCSGSDAVNSLACVCATGPNSNVKTNIIAGSSDTMKSFVTWFQTNFKGGSVPQLLQSLQCWWPACKGPTAGLNAYTVCPDVVENCFALVSDVQVSRDSKLKIRLKNECGLAQQPSQTTQGQPIEPQSNTTLFQAQLPLVLTAIAVALLVGVGAIVLGAAFGKKARGRRGIQ